MSVLEQASLVAIPSGYKASKLYSVVPSTGAGDLTFSRSTTATRINESGAIETMGINVPRIDFTGGGCGKYLFEPQRTNVHLYSDDFGSAWETFGSPSFVGGQSDPLGGTDAVLFNYPTTGDFYRLLNQTYVGTHTTSFYIKKGTATSFGYFYTPAIIATFNTSLGTVTSQVNCTATIETYGTDGWYYCTVTGDFATTNSQVRLSQGAVGSTYLAFFQTEAGSYATSYIPTSGSTVTRTADASSTSGLSSVINSEEGVLYFKGQSLFDDLTNRIISISDGTANNSIIIKYSSTTQTISADVIVAGVSQCLMTYAVADVTSLHGIAIRYKANDFSLWVDAVERATDTSGSTFSAATLDTFSCDNGAGGSPLYGKISELVLADYLTDTQMAALTTI